MVTGVILAIIAGCFVSIQNIFNNRVNQQNGSWATTTLVLAMGLIASLTMCLIVEGWSAFHLDQLKPWYVVSGLIGLGVVISLVHAIRLLGPTFAIAIVMTSELGFALLFDSFGWFGLTKVPFTMKQLFGVIVIIAGIFVFKLGGRRESKQVAHAKA